MSDTTLQTTPNGTTDLALPADNPFRVLDRYAGGIADEAPRIEAIATVSAGYKVKAKNKAGEEFWKPVASRRTDEKLFHLHDEMGRAPGLKAALEARSYRSLTIAFPRDDPREFIQQRFAQRTATELKAYGDERAVTVIQGGRHVSFPFGSDEYARTVAQCKVEVSVYFCLAEWEGAHPIVTFPDGFGAYYRLRFTSRNSVRSILTTLAQVAKFTAYRDETGGQRFRLTGIPFELTLDFRQVSDGEGKQMTIPVFVLVTRPPEGMRFDSRTFAAIMQAGLAQGQALMLPAPSQETYATALLELPEPDLDTAVPATDPPPVATPTDDQIEQLARGGTCDKAHWTRRWHAVVKGTWLDTDAARAAFLGEYTHGAFTSLSAVLDHMTESEAAELLGEVEEAIAVRRAQATAQVLVEDAGAPPDPRDDESSEPLPPGAERCTEPNCANVLIPGQLYSGGKARDVDGALVIQISRERTGGRVACLIHMPPPPAKAAK